jgi:Probable cobalt transporter subunit (CbtA)
MIGRLLLRGLLAGLVAGVLAFGFASIFGEPEVDRAIAFEKHMDMANGESPAPPLVNRSTQAGLGLFTGVVLYSAAMGGLFALVFALIYGRFLRFGPRATAALLAFAAFVSIVLVPALKYPANPPAVGDPETIRSRTALFFVMLVISVAALVFAFSLMRTLLARYGNWNGALLAVASYIVIVGIAGYALPVVSEVPEQFSAVVLWHFRIASLGIHVVLWTTIGSLFGVLAERAFRLRT